MDPAGRAAGSSVEAHQPADFLPASGSSSRWRTRRRYSPTSIAPQITSSSDASPRACPSVRVGCGPRPSRSVHHDGDVRRQPFGRNGGWTGAAGADACGGSRSPGPPPR
jgi:hypothetical protein